MTQKHVSDFDYGVGMGLVSKFFASRSEMPHLRHEGDQLAAGGKPTVYGYVL